MSSLDDLEPTYPARLQHGVWREGDRVFAPWEPNFLYAGVIGQIEGIQILVDFDDGVSGWVLIEQLKRCEISPAQKVECRRKVGAAYFPAEVLEVQQESLQVSLNAGRSKEWATISSIRIPCEPRGPAAVFVEPAQQLEVVEDLETGDRVWAPWIDGILFVGTVREIRDQEAHIHFDDGDQGWVTLAQVREFEVPVGLRVMGRWKMGQQFYPGTVAEVQGERIHIHYDDGDKEWIKPAALALPAQTIGPDARPTKNPNPASSGLKGWIIPLAIALGLAFMRASCR